MIRLFFPELSEERRQEFVKIIRKKWRKTVESPYGMSGATPWNN